jgi:hypothetical protein
MNFHIEREFSMNKKLALGGLCVALVFAGCSSLFGSLRLAMDNNSLGRGTTIGKETTVMYPGGGGEWAAWLYESASNDATKKATYQTVQQFEEWPFLCYDYEMDKAELARGLRAGIYRAGEAYYQPGTGNSGYTGRGVSVESTITPGYTYYAVHMKKIVNQTVDAVDQAKYQTYYSTILNEKTAALQQKYNDAARTYRDVSDDEVFVYVNGGTVKGKKIKSTLYDQLLNSSPGTILLNGGVYNSWIIKAEIVDGILKCQISE